VPAGDAATTASVNIQEQALQALTGVQVSYLQFKYPIFFIRSSHHIPLLSWLMLPDLTQQVLGVLYLARCSNISRLERRYRVVISITSHDVQQPFNHTLA
jgi:hypothetical protein